MITPKVKLYFADGTKKKILLYDRPPELNINLTLEDGSELKNLCFRRTGPDEYKQKIFRKKQG